MLDKPNTDQPAEANPFQVELVLPVKHESIEEKLARIIARRQRETTDKPSPAVRTPEAAPPQSVQSIPEVALPVWSNDHRGIMNDALRTSLFAAVQGKNRKMLKEAELASMDGTRLRFTGEQFDQSDLDVWSQLLHIARGTTASTPVVFRLREFLRQMDRNDGHSDREWLIKTLKRLQSGFIQLETGFNGSSKRGTFWYRAPLITAIAYAEDGGNASVSVKFDERLRPWFESGWSALNWEHRRALRRKPLALWLLGFYSSHAKAYGLKVQTLCDLSGCTTESLSGFRRLLKKAGEDLTRIGAIVSLTITDKDLVEVERTPTEAQAKHLQRKQQSNNLTRIRRALAS